MMSKPAKYVAELFSYPALSSFSWRPSAEFYIWEHIEDSAPLRFLMSSHHADCADSDAQAVRVLTSLSRLYNSVEKIAGSSLKLEPLHFYRMEGDHSISIRNVEFTHHSNEYMWPFLSSDILVPITDAKPFDLILTKSKSDSNLLKILRLLQRETNWDDLHRIYELFQQTNNVELKRIASNKKLMLFSRTANHPVAGGDRARHAHSNQDPPQKPMSIHEAEMLIYTIAQEIYNIQPVVEFKPSWNGIWKR